MKKFEVTFFTDMDGTMVEWRKASYGELFEKGFYRDGKPMQTVVDALGIISEEVSVMASLSAYLNGSKYALPEKNAWLDEHADFIPAGKRYFVPTFAKSAPGNAKIRFVERQLGRKLSKCDILLDDYSVNLHEWEAAGGTAIKVLNGVNGTNGTWKGAKVSAFTTANDCAKALRNILTEVSTKETVAI